MDTDRGEALLFAHGTHGKAGVMATKSPKIAKTIQRLASPKRSRFLVAASVSEWMGRGRRFGRTSPHPNQFLTTDGHGRARIVARPSCLPTEHTDHTERSE